MSVNNAKGQRKIAEEVMRQIQSGKITMRPRWHFALLAALGVAVAITTAVLAIFLTNLVVFKLRLASSDRPMYGLRANLHYFTSHFPWLALLCGIVSISLLLWIIRKFDFSYHLGRWLLVAVVIVSLTAGTTVAFTNINNSLETFGPMRGVYGGQHMQTNQGHEGGMGTHQQNNSRPASPDQNGNDRMLQRGQQNK